MKYNPPSAFMPACALELSVVAVVMREGNGQRFKMPRCTLGNVASAVVLWGTCAAVCRVALLCLRFCRTWFVFWFLIHLPDNGRCLLLCLFSFLTLDTAAASPTRTHTYWMPLNALPSLSVASTVQQYHRRGFDRIDSANFIVVFQSERPRVPHSGGLRFTWSALFVVCNSCSPLNFTMLLFSSSRKNLHNLKRINEKQKAVLANCLNVFVE